ncbi:MAG: 23S rRNA (adenine(2503)-C(2))-methyltransferase RlmN [Deltaproteobacteria bacterium]
MVDIKNLTVEELSAFIAHLGKEKFRASQIIKWVYQKRVRSFDDMTNLAKDFREALKGIAFISTIQATKVEVSKDGTKKYLFHLKDGNSIESVLIPDEDRLTLCISSQVGCPLDCGFCMTGSGGFVRNLDTSEIINQICAVQDDLPEEAQLTNIVLMGMGEPLLNYDNVLKAIKIMIYGEGMSFSTRKITVSTSGIVPEMLRLGSDTNVNLAVSLNATTDEVRTRLMPVNKKYPLNKLLSACREYPLPPRRRITFEYILIKGINDSLEDARRLARLVKGIPCKINLIPYNEHAGSEFRRPSDEAIRAFQEILQNVGYTALLRTSKGLDISAACGQLRGKLLKDLHHKEH